MTFGAYEKGFAVYGKFADFGFENRMAVISAGKLLYIRAFAK